MTNVWSPEVVWSRPENERDGTPLIVMFHGYLSHERDLIGLAPMLPDEFTLASVRAPHALGPGYTWFPLLHEPEYSIDRVTSAVDDVISWLETVEQRHSSVTLLGFSMGMAVATSVLRRRPAGIDAVVGLSGFAIPTPSDYFADDALRARRTPLFWGRGDADQIITEDKIEFTNEWAHAATDLTKMMYTGLAHSINQAEMGHVAEFLRAKVLTA
ncbi:alpha/beta hydrolase [Zhihengliuella flava]|uniref:Phospholipase/carboxylesterase n=1 Tax=Zhihengliuella flava TaxID=1285193 RepID=A0A931DBU7_9MICC|nr:dienelactone hydrolase family protein [Zhihengliuella flava]MBG6083880.1 phospholipase/carboxylesterase [Zhihengliuella flava]